MDLFGHPLDRLSNADSLFSSLEGERGRRGEVDVDRELDGLLDPATGPLAKYLSPFA
jgi:hypothetical protein